MVDRQFEYPVTHVHVTEGKGCQFVIVFTTVELHCFTLEESQSTLKLENVRDLSSAIRLPTKGNVYCSLNYGKSPTKDGPLSRIYVGGQQAQELQVADSQMCRRQKTVNLLPSSAPHPACKTQSVMAVLKGFFSAKVTSVKDLQELKSQKLIASIFSCEGDYMQSGVSLLEGETLRVRMEITME